MLTGISHREFKFSILFRMISTTKKSFDVSYQNKVLKIEFECFFYLKKERIFVDSNKFSIATGFDSFGKS